MYHRILTSCALQEYAFVEIHVHTLCTNEAHVHVIYHGLLIEIYGQMLHHNQHKQMDSQNHGI